MHLYLWLYLERSVHWFCFLCLGSCQSGSQLVPAAVWTSVKWWPVNRQFWRCLRSRQSSQTSTLWRAQAASKYDRFASGQSKLTCNMHAGAWNAVWRALFAVLYKFVFDCHLNTIDLHIIFGPRCLLRLLLPSCHLWASLADLKWMNEVKLTLWLETIWCQVKRRQIQYLQV